VQSNVVALSVIMDDVSFNTEFDINVLIRFAISSDRSAIFRKPPAPPPAKTRSLLLNEYRCQRTTTETTAAVQCVHKK